MCVCEREFAYERDTICVFVRECLLVKGTEFVREGLLVRQIKIVCLIECLIVRQNLCERKGL